MVLKARPRRDHELVMSRTPLFESVSSLDDDAVYRGVIDSRNLLDSKLSDLADAKSRKRQLELKRDDVEWRVAGEERAAHPDFSATAMEKHLKGVLHANSEWLRLRDEIAEVDEDIDDLSADKSALTRDIEIGCARLQSLAGKYMFLGSMSVSEAITSVQVNVSLPEPLVLKKD
jgi:hypothetical protein